MGKAEPEAGLGQAFLGEGQGRALGSRAPQIQEGASCRMRAARRGRGLRTLRRREGLLEGRGGGFLEGGDPSGSGLQRDKRGVPREGRPWGRAELEWGRVERPGSPSGGREAASRAGPGE